MNNVFKSEYLIIGNTFEGVQRAIQLARQGRVESIPFIVKKQNGIG